MNPDHLLELARDGVARSTVRTKRPRQADLRRSVSTAYYAVFHALLESVAGTFTSGGREWVMFYRSLDHKQAKKACSKLAKASLDPAERTFFAREAFSEELRNFASSFVRLQEKRHSSDYAPDYRVYLQETVEAINEAEAAIRCLLMLKRPNARNSLPTFSSASGRRSCR